jgi:amino-acid N-acetyltransferase
VAHAFPKEGNTEVQESTISIRPADEQDVLPIVEMVNRYAAQNLMLPRSEASVRASLADWLVAVDHTPDGERVAGCGSLVALTDALVEIRSLAIHEDYQGQGIGGKLVLALVEMAREREYKQVCALTLRESFFTRLGFELVDRWSISPKVWQACIYCPKFHRCDEVAVLMHLVPQLETVESVPQRAPAWNTLLRWEEWQPLRLAYQQKSGEREG